MKIMQNVYSLCEVFSVSSLSFASFGGLMIPPIAKLAIVKSKKICLNAQPCKSLILLAEARK